MTLSHLRVGPLDAVECRPATPAAGPPLALIHGLGGGVWGWENFQRYFAARGLRSVALELPGHSQDPARRTANIGSISVESYALYCAAALAELEPAVVIGHSMGGLIAQKLAETMPQPGYVFLASAPPWHMLRRAYWPLWRLLLRHPWREIIAPAFNRPMLFDRTLEDKLVNNRLNAEQRASLHARDVPDSGRASLQMAAGLVSVDPSAIGSPRLVAGGTADRLIAPSETARLAAFHGCPLRLFDRGHMLILEPGWEQVATAIADWVAALGPGESAATGQRPMAQNRGSAMARYSASDSAGSSTHSV